MLIADVKNFRDIVGKFVLINDTLTDPECDKCVAYCYIDLERGISFRVVKLVGADKAVDVSHEMIILRHHDEMELEMYDDPTEDMLAVAKSVDENYTPSDMYIIRDNEAFDEFRDNRFPDDLLLDILSMDEENNMHAERLWIRPIQIQDDGHMICVTLEKGEHVPIHSQVFVLEKNLVINGENNLTHFVGLDLSVGDYIMSQVDKLKEETNED